MTREKAIEILEDATHFHFPPDGLDFQNALKLGTEAIEFIQKWQDQLIKEGFSPLPGETEEVQ